MYKILIIEDEKKLALLMKEQLEDNGYTVDIAFSEIQGWEKFLSFKPNLVITDMKIEYPDSGINILKKIKDSGLHSDVIIITAYASLEVAVEAMKLGAFEYLTKPIRIENLLNLVQKLQSRFEKMEIVNIDNLVKEKGTFDNIVVGAPTSPMRRVYEMLARIIASDGTVLIRGESGTGKEVIAKAIHKHSSRSNFPFIQVNCAALVETLLESELFGIEERIATGVKARPGIFERANGGTVFLDEIGDMSLATQTKILRVLQEKSFERVGGNKTINVDVRIIAASNRDFEEEVKKGRFREDLYYRLNVLRITLPTLRERKDDIPYFIQFFLNKYSGLKITGITKSALKKMIDYDWPGNIRELENVIMRAIALVRGNVITEDELPRELTGKPTGRRTNEDIQLRLPDEGVSLDELERMMIIQALDRTNYNQTKAAKLLGISRRRLSYKIEKHNIILPFSKNE